LDSAVNATQPSPCAGSPEKRSPHPKHIDEEPARFDVDQMRRGKGQVRTNVVPRPRSGGYAAAHRSTPTRPRPSHAVTFGANRLGRRQCGIDRRPPIHALPKFRERWLADDPTQFVEEIVGQRHARQRRAGFEFPMQRLRHVVNLNHRGHVHFMVACATHVQAASIRAIAPGGGLRLSRITSPSPPTSTRPPSCA